MDNAERLKSLEKRVQKLESDNARLMDALAEAAKMILANQMARVMLPSAMRETLQAYVDRKGKENGGSSEKIA
jgi:hypothetical protein